MKNQTTLKNHGWFRRRIPPILTGVNFVSEWTRSYGCVYDGGRGRALRLREGRVRKGFMGYLHRLLVEIAWAHPISIVDHENATALSLLVPQHMVKHVPCDVADGIAVDDRVVEFGWEDEEHLGNLVRESTW